MKNSLPSIEPSLTEQQQHQLSIVLQSFAHLFSQPQGLPPTRSCAHAINLSLNHNPVSVGPYRYPHAKKKEDIERQVQQMLQQGIIRPSRSAYSSLVILVCKKDQSWRLFVDYRALNKVTIPDKFPIPVIEELLDELHGSWYFTNLDLCSEYHKILMKPEDIEKTTFRTHDGHYELLVMPFGLTNAPSTFQAIMNDLFRFMLRRYILVFFFYDILIYSRLWKDHLQHLQSVLHLLHLHQFFLNRKKCSFGLSVVDYLGHMIYKEGVAMQPSKVHVVLNWPIPQIVQGVRRFLGLTGYYRNLYKGMTLSQNLSQVSRRKTTFHRAKTLNRHLTS